MSALAYWKGTYGDPEAVEQQRAVGERVAEAFVAVLKTSFAPPGTGRKTNQALRAAHGVIEIGCGTGELARSIDDRYTPAVTYATDISTEALATARARHPQVRFERFDILADWPTHLGNFDLAVAASVLEHFRDWRLVVDRMLVLAERVIVIVPYRQPKLAEWVSEGGPQVVSRFQKQSFGRYRVLDMFTFIASGPRLAVMLAPK